MFIQPIKSLQGSERTSEVLLDWAVEPFSEIHFFISPSKHQSHPSCCQSHLHFQGFTQITNYSLLASSLYPVLSKGLGRLPATRAAVPAPKNGNHLILKELLQKQQAYLHFRTKRALRLGKIPNC